MAIVMRMRWDGVTADQYDAALKEVGWEADPAVGGLFHVAWFEKDGMNVVDVWERAEDFQRFTDERLLPVVKGKFNLPGEPTVEISDVHRAWDARNRQVVSG